MRDLLTSLKRLAVVERRTESLPELQRRIDATATALTALQRQTASLPELERKIDAGVTDLAATTARAGRMAETLDEQRRRLDAATSALSDLTRHVGAGASGHTDVVARVEGLAQLLDEHERHLQVRTVMDWVTQATLHKTPVVSVVLPTRDRAALLSRALASVHAQTYPHWELLVVDDGSVDDTPALLAGVSDPRVRAFRAGGAGVCAARNVALAHVRGEIVAYLDDDNLMHGDWLKAVVWGFEQRPEAEVLYGAFIVDDTLRIDPAGRGDLPRLYFHPYEHRAIAENNIADIGCIAHRAGLAEARFDESLREMGDWDLFLRLTRGRPPLALPAVACFYTTDAPNRLSYGPTHAADEATVRARNRR